MVEVIVLSLPGCHLCDDARLALEELSVEFPMNVREIAMASDEGMEFARAFRPAMPPAVIVDAELFSVGRLPRKKLRRRLEGSSA